MKASDTRQLIKVAHIKYIQSSQSIQSILRREAQLRAAIQDLSAQEDSANRTLVSDTKIRAIGAEIVWRSWVERSRRELNHSLAQVLVRKHAALDQVRLSFGRWSALQETMAAQNKRRPRSCELLPNRWTGTGVI